MSEAQDGDIDDDIKSDKNTQIYIEKSFYLSDLSIKKILELIEIIIENVRPQQGKSKKKNQKLLKSKQQNNESFQSEVFREGIEANLVFELFGHLEHLFSALSFSVVNVSETRKFIFQNAISKRIWNAFENTILLTIDLIKVWMREKFNIEGKQHGQCLSRIYSKMYDIFNSGMYAHEDPTTIEALTQSGTSKKSIKVRKLFAASTLSRLASPLAELFLIGNEKLVLSETAEIILSIINLLTAELSEILEEGVVKKSEVKRQLKIDSEQIVSLCRRLVWSLPYVCEIMTCLNVLIIMNDLIRIDNIFNCNNFGESHKNLTNILLVFVQEFEKIMLSQSEMETSDEQFELKQQALQALKESVPAFLFLQSNGNEIRNSVKIKLQMLRDFAPALQMAQNERSVFLSIVFNP